MRCRERGYWVDLRGWEGGAQKGRAKGRKDTKRGKYGNDMVGLSRGKGIQKMRRGISETRWSVLGELEAVSVGGRGQDKHIEWFGGRAYDGREVGKKA